LAGLCLGVLAETGRVLFGGNLHEVLPGQVYRCAQPSGERLEQIVQKYGIRTVVNLRGCADPWPWYLEEARATHRLGIAQEDICLSSGRLPSVNEIRRLVEVFDHTEYPILLHCRRGADRTGLASTIVLLLYTNVELAEGCRQLGLRYGHVSLGRPAYLDQFLDFYHDWLERQQLTHSPAVFRRWILHDYCPGECRSTIELLDPPASVVCGKPFALRIRVHNTSIQSWQLKPGTVAAIHASFFLWDVHDVCVAAGRSGLFEAEVSPGQSIDLTLAVPALFAPGRYRLLVDMGDERHCWFYQTGSEPLERELLVR
jgi:protein tyrosine phosphatase (PTP) superfamily phosphohydrolase (DUF442 family)